MSATPVVNNLKEGKSLLNLITGNSYDNLDTRPTIDNCVKIYKEMLGIGVRWFPKYDADIEKKEVEIDISSSIDDVLDLKVQKNSLKLEQLLTGLRLPTILQHIEKKTLIYTHLIQGIDHQLGKAIEQAGWKVGYYTGEEKAELEQFIRGDIDVLIGSSTIGTGIDGLQDACSKLIFNVLPWHSAGYDQIIGRLYRTGQKKKVEVIIPVTSIYVDGEEWSWDKTQLYRIQFKRTLADASVDGIIPENTLLTPNRAYQAAMKWLEKLDEEQKILV